MTRLLELTRAWAALTGLALIVWMVVLILLGHSLSYVLPMLISAIVGYEVALTGYEFWRRRHHG